MPNPIEKSNPITGHEINILTPNAHQPDPFGWIRLLNGKSDAGYVYLSDRPAPDPHLSFNKSYIVTQMPFSCLATLLDILRNQKNLQIRFYDPQAAGISPSAFIEPAVTSLQFEANGVRAPAEVADEIGRILATKT
jgi:hypothetical protein